MRIAIFSDIHGNAYAFEKVLAELERETFDQIVCLGDVIYGGAQPAETISLLRELGCPVVMGNTDVWFTDPAPIGGEAASDGRFQKLNAVRDWALSKLTAADRAYIAEFRPTVQLPLDTDRTLLCCHGSPASFDDVILPATPEAEFQGYLAAYLPDVMCGGHVHTPFVRRIGASDAFFFNPGAVGFAFSREQPADAVFMDAWAEYAVLSAENGRFALEFRRVPYDVSAIIGFYEASGRPYADEMVAQYRR